MQQSFYANPAIQHQQQFQQVAAAAAAAAVALQGGHNRVQCPSVVGFAGAASSGVPNSTVQGSSANVGKGSLDVISNDESTTGIAGDDVTTMDSENADLKHTSTKRQNLSARSVSDGKQDQQKVAEDKEEDNNQNGLLRDDFRDFDADKKTVVGLCTEEQQELDQEQDLDDSELADGDSEQVDSLQVEPITESTHQRVRGRKRCLTNKFFKAANELEQHDKIPANRSIHQRSGTVSPSSPLSENDDFADDDNNQVLDFCGIKKARHHHEDTSVGRSGPAHGSTGSMSDVDRGCSEDDDARSSSNSPVPQTEIKFQRPLGLLAQHGLSVKNSSSVGALHHHAAAVKAHQLHSLNAGPPTPGLLFPPFQFDPRGANGVATDYEREIMQQALQHQRFHGNAMMLDKELAAARMFCGLGPFTGPTAPTVPGYEFGSSPPGPSVAPLSLMDRRFMPSPPPNGATTPLGQDLSQGVGNGGSGTNSPGAHHWTFEEQFKQLYEMSTDPKRKEFLDDLFSFMQKRGTPVNRIPIMAKQTLDLYELFRLVVSKGGLVEVINKKLWREITKGLNLPSSITSAAFTLRTQYMKYLYPYECEKLKLSTLGELQSAIDGNRREGRRPGYGYDFSPLPPPPVGLLAGPPVGHLVAVPPPVGPLGGLPPPPGAPGGPPQPGTPVTPHHFNGSSLHPSMIALSRPGSEMSPKDDDRKSNVPLMSSASSSAHGHMRGLSEHDTRMNTIEVASRAIEEVSKRMEEASRAAVAMATASAGVSLAGCDGNSQHQLTNKQNNDCTSTMSSTCKRPPNLFDEDQRFLAQIGVPTTHLKISSHSNGSRLDFDNNSMVVSMEINGLMYQGVLFAQHPAAHRI